MLTEINRLPGGGGTISFVHPKPLRGNHKTYAPWLDRKLEKVEPIQISSQAYHEIGGAYIEQRGRIPFYERRRDNALVMVIDGAVFSDSEYKARRAARIAREGGIA